MSLPSANVDADDLRQQCAKSGLRNQQIADRAKLSLRTFQKALQGGPVPLRTVVSIANAIGVDYKSFCIDPSVAASNAKPTNGAGTEGELDESNWGTIWTKSGSQSDKLKEIARRCPAHSQLITLNHETEIEIAENGDASFRYSLWLANTGTMPLRGTTRNLYFDHPQDSGQMGLSGKWNKKIPVVFQWENDSPFNKNFFIAYPRVLKPFTSCRVDYRWKVCQEFIDKACYWDLSIPVWTRKASIKIKIHSNRRLKHWELTLFSDVDGIIRKNNSIDVNYKPGQISLINDLEHPRSKVKYGHRWEME